MYIGNVADGDDATLGKDELGGQRHGPGRIGARGRGMIPAGDSVEAARLYLRHQA